MEEAKVAEDIECSRTAKAGAWLILFTCSAAAVWTVGAMICLVHFAVKYW